MDLILEGLYLGDILGASNKDILQRVGITHILTVANNHPPKFPSSFNYKVVKVQDLPSTNLKPKFASCIQFIKEAIAHGGRVFVHCFAGVSRSVTIVIAYLMQEHGLSFNAAIRLVKSKRPFINPNDGFRKQLLQFQKELELSRKGEKKENTDLYAVGSAIHAPQIKLGKLIKDSLGNSLMNQNTNQQAFDKIPFSLLQQSQLTEQIPFKKQIDSNELMSEIKSQNVQAVATMNALKIEQFNKIKAKSSYGMRVKSMQKYENNRDSDPFKMPLIDIKSLNFNNNNRNVMDIVREKKSNELKEDNLKIGNKSENAIGISRAYNTQGGFLDSRFHRKQHQSILNQAIASSRFGLPLQLKNQFNLF